MTDVAILTPDPSDPSFRGQWPHVLERLSNALERAGVGATQTPWTDHVQDASALLGYPLVLPLLAWGYHRDHEAWMAACRIWEATDVQMLNPPSVLGWNSDKSYLGRLAARGVAIPETIWIDAPRQTDIDAAFDTLATETIVVKPTVSGGAWKTLRLARGEVLTDAPEGGAMIQSYLSSMETEGETSLLFFGGRLSHAVNKRPVTGDFRIQVQFGGIYETVAPPEGALALAAQVLAAIDEPLLYARIDMARGPQGEWLLMEAELIEPDFYLNNDPQSGGGFAQAVRARLEA